MAFLNKLGSLMRQSISQKGQVPVVSMLNSIRCMSSSKLFIGGLPWSTDDQTLRDAFSGYGEVTEARVIMDRETGRSRGFGFVSFDSTESASEAVSAMDGQRNGADHHDPTMTITKGVEVLIIEADELQLYALLMPLMALLLELVASSGFEFEPNLIRYIIEMAFFNKLGSLMRQSISQKGQVPVVSMLNSIRCMSSSRLFIGGLPWSTDDQTLKDAFSGFGEVTEARVIMDRETGRSRGFGFVHYDSVENASEAVSAMDGQDLGGRTVRVSFAQDRRPQQSYNDNNYQGNRRSDN
uniref:RRM domain-containing protein n=2 Tax=Salix viminalis TaxID=40686 RepID=A0A6N2MRR3_SALVM